MTNLTDFWQSQHSQNSPWLTGTTFDMILKQYDLTAEDFRDLRCLEIGVGRGTVTEPLSKLAETLYCCDISDIALGKAKTWAAGTWRTGQIDQVPPVDVALCHLVFVHCNDSECERILRSVNLDEEGRMFCQFSCFKDPAVGASDANEKIRNLLDLGVKHFFRTPSDIEDIIESADLKVRRTWARDPGSFHGWHGQFWQYYELYR